MKNAQKQKAVFAVRSTATDNLARACHDAFPSQLKLQQNRRNETHRQEEFELKGQRTSRFGVSIQDSTANDTSLQGAIRFVATTSMPLFFKSATMGSRSHFFNRTEYTFSWPSVFGRW